jgi:glycosyltransferase involved in cell wall biosynthesis
VRAPSPERAAALRARIGGAEAGIVIGTIASLTSKKGHEFLLRAVATLRDRGVASTLVLAGDGPERPRLEALTQQLGLAGRVHFLGAVPQAADVLAAIDVFVLPSLVEGLPLALLEAMRAGKAVIATAVGGVPEAVTAGVNGLVVAPGDDAALADAIASLAASPERRLELGRRAKETADREFTERVYVDALANLYHELLAR